MSSYDEHLISQAGGDGDVIGKIGDKVGYTLRQQHAGHWVDVDNYEFETISEAVCMLRDYQEEEPRATFAVARLELVMISRPEVTK